MLKIETQGTWREMGGQIAEAFASWFDPVLDHFAPWLARDLDAYRPAIHALRQVVIEHVPDVEEETQGMAAALNWDADRLLGLRFFNEIRHYKAPGCSGIFLADSDRGPLLARTSDLEPDISADIQYCRISRPKDGVATISVTYLPMSGGVGFNEHGLALTGSSATSQGSPAVNGIPTGIFNRLLLARCRSLDDVAALARRHTLRGKGAIQLVCDDAGGSMMLELAPGRPILVTPRRPERDWQVCSNFCQSKELVPASGPAYLENAYCRYGRMVHQLNEDGGMQRTLAGIQQLVLDVAQPGMVCHEPHCAFHTVYAFIIETRQRRMHLCPGHPAKTAYEEITL